jgi:hypothetical protein
MAPALALLDGQLVTERQKEVLLRLQVRGGPGLGDLRPANLPIWQTLERELLTGGTRGRALPRPLV